VISERQRLVDAFSDWLEEDMAVECADLPAMLLLVEG